MAIARARAIDDRPVVIDFIVAAALTTPNPSGSATYQEQRHEQCPSR